MTTSSITPEVVGIESQPQILENSPITAEEVQSRHRRMVKIKAAQLDKMERDLLIGKELLEITRTKEYRGIAEGESGLTFGDWLREESSQMMPDERSMSMDTASHLRGFYYFRNEVLPSDDHGRGTASLPLPTAARQVRPLLFLLDHLRRDTHRDDGRKTYEERRAAEAKAIDIWKGAVAEAKGVPTFDQVNRARLKDDAAEKHRLRGSASTRPPQSKPDWESINRADEAQIQNTIRAGIAESVRTPTPDYSPTPSPQPSAPAAPSIPAWEIQTDDSSVDAGAECKRITQALNDAHKAIGNLRGILYSQTQRYGSDYLGFLRQVDAGVYSLNNIDDQVQQMGEDIQRIMDVLASEAEPGELAQSTIDVDSMPSRA